jgi:hypothetical protein
LFVFSLAGDLRRTNYRATPDLNPSDVFLGWPMTRYHPTPLSSGFGRLLLLPVHEGQDNRCRYGKPHSYLAGQSDLLYLASFCT